MRKSSLIKISTAVFALLIFCLLLGGCKDNRTDDIVVDLSDYTIVRPENASKICVDAAVKTAKELKKKYSADLRIIDDWTKSEADIPVDGREILIGKTNRKQSSAALKLLGGEMRFSVVLSGQSIVIAAENDTLLDCAIDFFFDKIVKEADAAQCVSLPSRLEYKSEPFDALKIMSNDLPLYHILYDGGLNSAVTSVYTSVKDCIDRISGKNNQTISTDILPKSAEYDSKAREILIGNTDCAETADAMRKLSANQYGIFVVGNKIAVCGRTRTGDSLAVKKFNDLLKAGAVKNDDGTVSISVALTSESLVYTVKEYDFDFPRYEKTPLDYAYDCGDGVLGEYYEGVSEKDLDDYGKVLTDANFTRLYANTIGTAKYSAYENDKVRVFVSYAPHTSGKGLLKVISESAARPYIQNEEGKRVCDPSITQLSLSYTPSVTNGMGYILRLEDSSFVIWDGGFTDDAVTIMRELERLSVTKEKPVIRAWILTHMHGDHYQAFESFAKNFADKVTLEYLALNVPDSYYVPEVSNVYTNGKIRADLMSFSEAKTVKLHAGMVLKYPGAEIEILLTHEELYPEFKDLEFVNDCSVVSRFNVQNQKMIFPGDAQTVASDKLVSLYGKYLKSDFVQVSHHGSLKRGATVELYEYILPRLAFFPGSAGRFGENKNTDANRFIINCVKGERNVIVADGGNKTFVLPIKQGIGR